MPVHKWVIRYREKSETKHHCIWRTEMEKPVREAGILSRRRKPGVLGWPCYIWDIYWTMKVRGWGEYYLDSGFIDFGVQENIWGWTYRFGNCRPTAGGKATRLGWDRLMRVWAEKRRAPRPELWSPMLRGWGDEKGQQRILRKSCQGSRGRVRQVWWPGHQAKKIFNGKTLITLSNAIKLNRIRTWRYEGHCWWWQESLLWSGS